MTNGHTPKSKQTDKKEQSKKTPAKTPNTKTPQKTPAKKVNKSFENSGFLYLTLLKMNQYNHRNAAIKS